MTNASDSSPVEPSNLDITSYRPLVFGIAYRMLGSVAEAEDLSQEAFLRLHRALQAGEVIERPQAYLTSVTTRLAIDHLRSARVRRESYVGIWLPEPLVDDRTSDTAPQVGESLAMAFLVILETLSPTERAVFLLREVFEYGYDEIGPILGKSQDNCRQIFARAKHHIDAGRPRFEPSAVKRDELARRFFIVDGVVHAVRAVINPDKLQHLGTFAAGDA